MSLHDPSASSPGAGDPRPLLAILHGVNLNLLGERPSEHYGTMTLSELELRVSEAARDRGFRTICHQTNHEGEYVELIHRLRTFAAAMIVNPGAWTHYSYAIRDALEIVAGPVAEVHLSDIATREDWRRHSVISDVCARTISGGGVRGYEEAVDFLADSLSIAPERGIDASESGGGA